MCQLCYSTKLAKFVKMEHLLCTEWVECVKMHQVSYITWSESLKFTKYSLLTQQNLWKWRSCSIFTSLSSWIRDSFCTPTWPNREDWPLSIYWLSRIRAYGSAEVHWHCRIDEEGQLVIYWLGQVCEVGLFFYWHVCTWWAICSLLTWPRDELWFNDALLGWDYMASVGDVWSVGMDP